MPATSTRTHNTPTDPAGHAPTDTPTDTPTDDEAAKSDSKAAKTDSKAAKAKGAPDLFVVVAQPREGGQLVQLHSEDTAAAFVSMLTYGSRQHRKEAEDAEEQVPDGGGSYEINRRDIRVYRLNATEVNDF